MTDLVSQLPSPPGHDDDGFAMSFEVDRKDEIRCFFEEYGYVVVRDVLSQHEVQASCDELFAKFDRDDEASVNEFLGRYENQLARLGIIGIRNDLTSPTQLANRQNERVYRAFAAVYDDERLFVDHDRLGAMRPTRLAYGSHALVETVLTSTGMPALMRSDLPPAAPMARPAVRARHSRARAPGTGRSSRNGRRKATGST